jgi:hypothetical protein
LGRFARAMPVIIDPALYMKKKGDLFWIPQKRELPTAFKLFGGKHAFLHPLLPNFFTSGCIHKRASKVQYYARDLPCTKSSHSIVKQSNLNF